MAAQVNFGWKLGLFIILIICLFFLFGNFKINDTLTGTSQNQSENENENDSSDDELVPQKEYVPCPCNIIFEKYYPSEFETTWMKLINTFDKKSFCETQKKMSPQLNLWLKVVDILSKNSSADRLEESHPDYQEANKIFSKFTYSVRCAGKLVKSFEKWIEPIGLSLKHPLYNNGCEQGDGKSHLTSRSYILLDSIQHREKSDKFALIDIGSYVYVKGTEKGPSQAYLHSAYKSRGIIFNKLMMWDPNPRDDEIIFSQVPDDWYPYYQYFNVLPISEISDPRNPLNLLKLFATPQHFVSIKVTLTNNTAVEYQFLKKMMQEPEVYHSIDELFFEPKFQFDGKNPPLKYSYGAFNLDEIYTVFYHLRLLGIRAHGW